MALAHTNGTLLSCTLLPFISFFCPLVPFSRACAVCPLLCGVCVCVPSVSAVVNTLVATTLPNAVNIAAIFVVALT